MSETRRKTQPEPGFTLVEMIVGVAIISVLMVLGAPLVLKTIQTAKMTSTGFDCHVLVRRAQTEAVKKNSPAVVRADLTAQELVAFVDVHGPNPDNDPPDPPDGIFNPVLDGRPFTTTDHELGSCPMPEGISFAGPTADPAVISGFTTIGSEQVAILETDGTVRNVGGFRIGDTRGNYLEIQIAPVATARVTLRKWNETLGAWKAQGEDDEKWIWF